MIKEPEPSRALRSPRGADAIGGQTTLPGPSTRADTAGAAALCIRWLFPITDGPVTSVATRPLVLGRDAACDTVLPGRETSRRHAEVRRDGPLLLIRDLGSRNGLGVNGERVAEAPLAAGDVIRLGDWVGVVCRGETPLEQPMFGSLAPGLFAGPALARALEPVRRAARSGLPIVVQGETGTGKERVARAVHDWSGRSGAFIAVNCAAIAESLAEAELFGHSRGAFTGAHQASLGHFRAANGGTIFLDEVADFPERIQPKLLRVLERREVVPLGESLPVPTDVLIVVAAQAPLEQSVREGRFRGDLFARLDGLSVCIPPLRERVEEVPYLFARFLNESSGGHPPPVEAKLVEQLCLYDWPFNVRELLLTVQRLLALSSPGSPLRRADLPARLLAPSRSAAGDLRSAAPPPLPAAPAAIQSPRGASQQELDALVAALRRSHGNVAEACLALGITRARAYRLMERRAELDLNELRQEVGLDRGVKRP